MIAIQFDQMTNTLRWHKGQMLLRQHVANWLRGAHPGRFPALADVSFSLPQAACLDIVGHHVASKSTRLNLITGVCRPTTGKGSARGRVASLLELVSGFHRDLMGVEDVHINAALLGLTRKQTESLFRHVEQFAEIGNFMNEPLRTSFLGMTMRLAFAVAMHMDPDILIIDEVFGVGGKCFLEKCADRIQLSVGQERR